MDFTVARDSEWQWHQLGHVQVCTTLRTDNHASTQALSFLQTGYPTCRPTNSIKALKATYPHTHVTYTHRDNPDQQNNQAPTHRDNPDPQLTTHTHTHARTHTHTHWVNPKPHTNHTHWDNPDPHTHTHTADLQRLLIIIWY